MIDLESQFSLMEETEVIGEDDDSSADDYHQLQQGTESIGISIHWEVDTDNYYDQFNDAVLVRTLQNSFCKTVSDAEEIFCPRQVPPSGEKSFEVIATYGQTILEEMSNENQLLKIPGWEVASVL